jgi:putative nucleotidyltransferase with HDIG domain
MIKSLALSLGVIQSLPRGKGSKFFSQEGLWLHSLTVATTIKELAFKLGKREESSYLFIIGLLHDIGKLVLDQFFQKEFMEVLSETNSGEGKKLHVVEKKIIGIDHCEISAMLLKRWKFPVQIIDPIRELHASEYSKDTNVSDISMLRVSNIISQELKLGLEGNVQPNKLHTEDFENMKTTTEVMENLKLLIDGKRDGIIAFFEALT